MPELPEVETARRGLAELVEGKVLAKVVITWPRIIHTDQPLEEWAERLVGQRIHHVNRRGKYLIFELDQDALLSHLRMEGKYRYFSSDDQPEEVSVHVHVRFYFTDGSQLHYQDVRKFGRMELLPLSEVDDFFIRKGLGPEPTEASFELATFSKGLNKHQKAIKLVLLDQKVVAGLGNIYVDEVLFRACVHPARPSNSLTQAEVESLHQAIIAVMAEATAAGGTTIRTYENTFGQPGHYQDYLQVYAKAGEACPRCGSSIEKIKLGQRGTHFCPNCQVLL